jgi:hypothetical protein
MKLEISKSLRLKVTRDSGLRGYGTKESGLVNGLASESSRMDFERKTKSIQFLVGLPLFFFPSSLPPLMMGGGTVGEDGTT